MAFESEFYTQSESTWDLALKASYVFNDSFREDFMRTEYWTPKYDLSKTPLLLGYHRTMQVPTFRVVTQHFARSLYFYTRTNPRIGVSLTKDTATNEYVAMASFTLPKYVAPFKPSESCSLFRWIRSWYSTILFRIQDIWAFKSLENPSHPPAMASEFQYGAVHCNALETPERMKLLQSMDRKQLAETSYPKPWSYYSNWFGVLTQYQGQGLGRKVLDEVIEVMHTKAELKEPTAFDGPAKLESFASPRGVPFYTKYGFSIGATTDKTVPSGRTLTHTFFYMNST